MKRILIADDHKSALRSVRAALESNPGWKVCGEAADGVEALAKAIALRPDLVILDFAMPGLNGLRAAEKISDLLPAVPIVLHTVYGSEVRLKAREHGISRVVEKANSSALVSAVEELLVTQP